MAKGELDAPAVIRKGRMPRGRPGLRARGVALKLRPKGPKNPSDRHGFSGAKLENLFYTAKNGKTHIYQKDAQCAGVNYNQQKSKKSLRLKAGRPAERSAIRESPISPFVK
jgi:hypothetical protein